MLRNIPHVESVLAFSHQLKTGGMFLTFEGKLIVPIGNVVGMDLSTRN